jgi:hypothetical protein
LRNIIRAKGALVGRKVIVTGDVRMTASPNLATMLPQPRLFLSDGYEGVDPLTTQMPAARSAAAPLCATRWSSHWRRQSRHHVAHHHGSSNDGIDANDAKLSRQLHTDVASRVMAARGVAASVTRID